MTDQPPDPLKDWMDKRERNLTEVSAQPCCGNCRFATKTQTVNQLGCTRYPPQAFLLPPNQIISQFPIVQSRQLCGEWQQKLDS